MHISQKSRLGLAAAVVGVMIVLVAVFGYNDQHGGAGVASGKWLPGLAPLLGQVDKVRIRSSSGAVTLQRDGTRWVVEERAGYAASFPRLQSLLDALATARLIEPKTMLPQNFNRLGLDDIEHPGSDAVLIEIWAATAEPIERVLIGHADSARGGRFVRQASEQQTWLIDTSPQPLADPADWLDRRMLDVDFSRVATVERGLAGNPGFRVTRATAATDASLALETLPAGKALRYVSVFDAAARSILTMTPEDVRKAAGLDFVNAPLTRIVCFDGLVIEARVLQSDDGNWMTLDVHGATGPDVAEQAAGTDSEKSSAMVREEAATLQHRIAGWAYRVSDYVYGEASKTLDDYLQDAAPPASATGGGATVGTGEGRP